MTKSPKVSPHRHAVKNLDLEPDTHKTGVVPLNILEQKEQFLKHGKIPKFTFSSSEDEIENVYNQPKHHIRFDLLGEAMYIINMVKEKYGNATKYFDEIYGDRISVSEATDIIIEYLQENNLLGAMSVIWCKDLPCSARMMWSGPQGKFNRPEARKYSLWISCNKDNVYLRKDGLINLAEHEVGTHYFRSVNDGFQPWYIDRKKFNLRSLQSFEMLRSEEGLAVLNSMLRAKGKYLFLPALSYYAACRATEMTFKQLFDHLAKYVPDQDHRWKMVTRIKRGLINPNDYGGFGKDQCYFEGAVNILRNYEEIDFTIMMSGKLCTDEVKRVSRCARTNCIKLPKFMRNERRYKKILREIAQLNGLDKTYSMYRAPSEYVFRLEHGRCIGEHPEPPFTKLTKVRRRVFKPKKKPKIHLIEETPNTSRSEIISIKSSDLSSLNTKSTSEVSVYEAIRTNRTCSMRGFYNDQKYNISESKATQKKTRANSHTPINKNKRLLKRPKSAVKLDIKEQFVRCEGTTNS